MDYSFFRQEGTRHLERLAGAQWTDFNAHDPGITILEQLCYALTDLAYRTEFALPDLLTREGAQAYDSLYTPNQALPSSPVTLADLRKLVIDVPGVNNAWIEIVDEPLVVLAGAKGGDDVEVKSLLANDAQAEATAPSSKASEVRVTGLYRVRIEKSDVLGISADTIGRDAIQRLHRYRGLGQDYEAIEVLGKRDVRLGATLEIEAVDDASVLLANVYQKIEEYLSPTVPFYTLEEMLARRRWVDEIFEGPLLEHGFIDEEDLAKLERRTSVRISDLIREIMMVPGIVAVRSLHFLTYDGKRMEDWLLDVNVDETPRFDLSDSKIALVKRGLPVGEGLYPNARALFLERAEKAARPARAAGAEPELRPPPGRNRNVASYHSVQQHFPMVYGIGAASLPRSAPAERKAQAKQLKAYLMFYDQVLANQFAQLANIGKLFSFHDDPAHGNPAQGEEAVSYFSQPVPDDGTLGLDAIRNADPEPHRRHLQDITEHASAASTPVDSPSESGLRRRNRFLDHLLARFGEQFRDYALMQSGETGSTDGMTEEDRATRLAELAQDKRAFLRDYERIGRDRGAAFNCLETSGGDNRSGLELTLRRKLGIRDPKKGMSDLDERLYVVEHILLRPIAADQHQSAPLLRVAADRKDKVSDPYSLQISVVLPSWGRFERPSFKAFVEQTIFEETPAHLTVHILWRDSDAMEAFESDHARWLERLRERRRAELGLAP